MGTAHSKLGPSAASRWLACTGSVALSAPYPNTTSEYAEEGTAAHNLVDAILRTGKTGMPSYKATAALEYDDRGYPLTNAMYQHVSDYVEYVNEHREVEGVECFIEVKTDFDYWVPNGFGTVDCLIIKEGEAHVIDLKYGQGIPVSARENPQLMLYALGAFSKYGVSHDLEKFKLTIHQPRLDSVSTWEISADDLLVWAEKVKLIAQKITKGDTNLVPGETQCRFCKAKNDCPALGQQMEDMAREGFEAIAEAEKTPMEKRGTDFRAKMLAVSENWKLLTKYREGILAASLEDLEHGRPVEGYKLVHGRGTRTWKSGDATVKAVEKALGKKDAYVRKMVTPPAAEKLLNKKHPLLQEHVIKLDGKLTIALESDKRQSVDVNPTEGFTEVAD